MTRQCTVPITGYWLDEFFICKLKIFIKKMCFRVMKVAKLLQFIYTFRQILLNLRPC